MLKMKNKNLQNVKVQGKREIPKTKSNWRHGEIIKKVGRDEERNEEKWQE